jgi:hypothetical protein
MSGYGIFQATLQESLSGLTIFESQPAEKNSHYALAVVLAHSYITWLPGCIHILTKKFLSFATYMSLIFWVCIQIHDQKFKQVAQEQL